LQYNTKLSWNFPQDNTKFSWSFPQDNTKLSQWEIQVNNTKLPKQVLWGQHQEPPWDNPSCPKGTSSSLFKDKPTVVPNPNPKTSQADP
jgi:hypothetical protein